MAVACDNTGSHERKASAGVRSFIRCMIEKLLSHLILSDSPKSNSYIIRTLFKSGVGPGRTCRLFRSIARQAS
jgi:hypothetical protein